MKGFCSDAVVLEDVNNVRKEKETVLILGRRFGKLIPFEKIYGRYKKDNKTVILYKCHCDCGNDIIVSKSYLLHGASLDCGCVKREKEMKYTVAIPMKKQLQGIKVKHKGRMYNIWKRMKARCKGVGGQNTIRYYAGRGIRYQESWGDYNNFYNDMIDGYADNLQLDRIDINGDYTKENCRWVTAKENCRNRRDNSIVIAGGEIHALAWWLEKYGITNKYMLSKLLKRDYGEDWEIKKGHRQNWLSTL